MDLVINTLSLAKFGGCIELRTNNDSIWNDL